LALVEEEARLVARRPDEETHLVLGDLRLDVAERSRVLIDVRRKPLPVGRDARHLEDDAHISEKLDEELAEELPATKEARGVELENDQARIAVDDEPAQPVPFGMDDPVGIGSALEPEEVSPERHRPGEPLAEEVLIERQVRVVGDKPNLDVRAPVPEPAPDRETGRARDEDLVAVPRLPRNLLDRTPKDPRMT